MTADLVADAMDAARTSALVAIKGVPPENRAEVIRATGSMFKREGPLALIFRVPGIRRKELSGREPMDGDE
jgi:hypothetical protein